jgi:Rad3-related DNA helicase
LNTYPNLSARSTQYINPSFRNAQIGLTNYATHSIPIRHGSDQWKPNVDVLIIDEAHNLIDFIRENETLYLWRHKYNYTPQTLREWFNSNQHRNKQFKSIIANWDEFTIQTVVLPWKGGGTDCRGHKMIRGEEYELEALKITPINISRYIGKYIPRSTKSVLLSSTIAPDDMEILGLSSRKCIYLESVHPIPSDRRPIYLNYVGSISRSNMASKALDLANKIKQISVRHPAQKGLIHATYELAELLRPHLKSNRFVFHNRDDRLSKYQEFRDSPASKGQILVASGMYEGVDLPEDLGRFQILAKIPWLSLGDPVNKYYFDKNRAIYEWNTIKTTIQACGRICRTPEDRGATYIVDGSFERIRNSILLPKWFIESVVDINK